MDIKKVNPWYWVHKILPHTLFARSLLIIVVPVLLLQIVVMSVFVDNHWRKITSRLAFSVAGEIAIIAEEIESGADEERLDSLSNYAAQNLDLLITFEPNEQLTPEIITEGAWEPFTARALSKSLEGQVRRPFSLSLSPEDNWVNIGIQLDNGVLRVLALERRLFSSSSYIFLFWLWGSSIILFTIAVVFMRNQIRPIKRLAKAAEMMGTGREFIFKPEGAQEVRQAGRAFIDMHDRIIKQVEQRTAMLAGISHDLRTPLTRLKLGLSFLEEGEDSKALRQDIQDMERMIEGYLDFVRGEADEPTKNTNIKELIEKIIDATKRHGTNILFKDSPDVWINIKPLAIERCITNIINNAEKYGSEITVFLEDNPKSIIINIDDNGIGIDPKQYEDVFKPFFRADISRNAATGGVGLGLPIVKDIVQSHGGAINLDKSLAGGLRVELELPK